MSDYPEHDKLHKIKDQSQTIGEFLDFGLPAQGIMLYEQRFFNCDCRYCENGEAEANKHHQFDVEHHGARFVNGKCQHPSMAPTNKTIKQILAEHFDIDQAKLDEEGDRMLAALRSKDD